MRRVIAASCALASLIALAACSTDDSASKPANDGVVHLSLSTNGNGDLVLKGALNNPSYLGIYPNPDHWTSIDYYLGDDLVPVAICKRGDVTKRCTETPFFVEIKATGGVQAPTAGGDLGLRTYGTPPPDDAGAPPPSDSPPADTSSPSPAPSPSSSDMPPAPPPPPAGSSTTATVSDVNGTPVAQKTVPPPSSTSAPAPAPAPSTSGSTAPMQPAGSTCGDTAAMGGAPGTGGFSKQGETAACQAASLADTPGCDGMTVAAAAKVYCDAVNAQLPAAEQIDCTILTSSTYTPSALPTTRTGGDCSTYWEPAATAVQNAGYDSCEKVKLLLSQWRDRARHELISNGVCTSSPLVVDLDGDGIHLSSLEHGVAFDLLGGGEKVRSAWTDGKDAFLALDRNANGSIDGASELFGNGTADGTWADGFAALAALDDDGNGVIDARDRVFSHLVLWRDADRDGASQPSELTTLRDAGVRWISVEAVRRSGPSSLDAYGNEIPLAAEFGRRDGSHGALVDAFLRYRPIR